jgi:hypothetical protein
MDQTTSLPKIQEWRAVDLQTLQNEIIPRAKPAVIKGLVNHWPIVRASTQSPQALLNYIRARDLAQPVRIMVGRPDIKGVYFYRDDMTGLNFEHALQPFHSALASILEHMNDPAPPAIYTGATSVEENFPDIARENTLDILARPAKPRLWLGNAVTAATHYDNLDGINCIITGRKRFTFFPPEQFRNLYIGPLDLSPGGQPTSMVRMSAPDLERYPRFAQAMAEAEVADVEPGDAIFVPRLWWHNVDSLEPLNLSMNYWWFEGTQGGAEPFAAMAHALLAITPLSAVERERWRQMFDHYVFRTDGDPVPYLPPDKRGMLGPTSAALAGYMRAQLIRSLAKSLPGQLREQILRLMTPRNTR